VARSVSEQGWRYKMALSRRSNVVVLDHLTDAGATMVERQTASAAILTCATGVSSAGLVHF